MYCQDEVAQLVTDEGVQAMSLILWVHLHPADEEQGTPTDLGELCHDDGTPRFEFMLIANDAARELRVGSAARSVGGIARAIVELLKRYDANSAAAAARTAGRVDR